MGCGYSINIIHCSDLYNYLKESELENLSDDFFEKVWWNKILVDFSKIENLSIFNISHQKADFDEFLKSNLEILRGEIPFSQVRNNIIKNIREQMIQICQKISFSILYKTENTDINLSIILNDFMDISKYPYHIKASISGNGMKIPILLYDCTEEWSKALINILSSAFIADKMRNI